jgi:hypothetical protein
MPGYGDFRGIGGIENTAGSDFKLFLCNFNVSYFGIRNYLTGSKYIYI